MNPRMRAAAHARGITGWDHPDASAATLGISQDAGAEQCDAVLAANRAPAPVVLPERIALADDSWRDVLPLELFVDF